MSQERIHDRPMEEIAGMENLGKIGPEVFAHELASTRILVGIGQVRSSSNLLPGSPLIYNQPWLAPSPYVGLCLVS